MKILVIDGMGGGFGKSIIEQLRLELKEQQGYEIIATGTNSLATAAMLQAGAKQAATGENAIVLNCQTADVIIGAIGIVLANAMLGEISPTIAIAVAASSAQKILVPVPKCGTTVAGLADKPLAQYFAEIPGIVRAL